MEYKEEDYLNIAGLQHFAFCRRQWALAYIEMQWDENLRTVEGHILHENAHNPFSAEKRGKLLISRGMAVYSRKLGVSGICDVVEFHASPKGVPIFGQDGKWLPVPVEYKRGVPKENAADRLQLCCQAICLEEMLVCGRILKAYLYYGETSRRTPVPLDDELRATVSSMLVEMHELYARRYTPHGKT
jgi:CRISPR-associated exonuclease Cas4